MRVVHLPVDVGGQAPGLARAERECGIDSTNIVFQGSSFGYSNDIDLKLNRYNVIFRYLARTYYLFKYIKKYDVFHFYFGVTFLPGNIDLLFFRILNKKVFFTFQGSDIRLKKITVNRAEKSHTLKFSYIPFFKFDWLKKIKVKFISAFSNHTFVLNPDLLLVSPDSTFLPYTHVASQERIEVKHKPGDQFTIFHAPSNRNIKGTAFLTDAIDKLRSEGHNIKLLLAENTSTSNVKRMAKDTDLAVDQLKIGWYGGFAVEMMSIGIPVICYINPLFIKLANLDHRLPIINATSQNIAQVIRKLINNRGALEKIGQKSRDFTDELHNPKIIAAETTSYYTNAHR